MQDEDRHDGRSKEEHEFRTHRWARAARRAQNDLSTPAEIRRFITEEVARQVQAQQKTANKYLDSGDSSRESTEEVVVEGDNGLKNIAKFNTAVSNLFLPLKTLLEVRAHMQTAPSPIPLVETTEFLGQPIRKIGELSFRERTIAEQVKEAELSSYTIHVKKGISENASTFGKVTITFHPQYIQTGGVSSVELTLGTGFPDKRLPASYVLSSLGLGTQHEATISQFLALGMRSSGNDNRAKDVSSVRFEMGKRSEGPKVIFKDGRKSYTSSFVPDSNSFDYEGVKPGNTLQILELSKNLSPKLT